jgi:hypothetical protein
MDSENKVKDPVTIDSENVPKIRAWFQAGRGVTRWENMEIASGMARYVFTPGDTTSPNWRYGKPQPIQPSEITVETHKVLETFRGRFKAMYWGPWVQPGTEAKAERLCSKHGVAKGSWRWSYYDSGLVTVEILQTVQSPFELDGSHVKWGYGGVQCIADTLSSFRTSNSHQTDRLRCPIPKSTTDRQSKKSLNG